MDMTGVYDRHRLSSISEIMPRFSDVVREGDEVQLGLDGDPLFPEEWNTHRPYGVVTQVKNTDEGASLRVQLNSGETVTLPSYSLDPEKVWEFTDRSFENVLERQSDDVTYRSASPEADLQREIDELKINKMQQEQFNETLLSTLNEMARDYCKLAAASGEEAGFCNVFTTEYAKMMGPKEDKEDKFEFTSDFSDSDPED